MSCETEHVVDLIIRSCLRGFHLLLEHAAAAAATAATCSIRSGSKRDSPEVDHARVSSGHQHVAVLGCRRIANSAFLHGNRIQGSIFARIALAVPQDLRSFYLHSSSSSSSFAKRGECLLYRARSLMLCYVGLGWKVAMRWIGRNGGAGSIYVLLECRWIVSAVLLCFDAATEFPRRFAAEFFAALLQYNKTIRTAT